MMKTPAVLVTGFRPFLGEKINPSEILLEALKKDSQFQSYGETLLLPVSFAKAADLLHERLAQRDYDFILMLGQAGGREKINLERVALNWIESEHPDEEGFKPSLGPIVPLGESALFTSLPLHQWKESLKERHAVTVSLSAGGYVCNYVYYQTLKWLQDHSKKSQACFIHVPYLPEQTAGKPEDTPAMELSSMQSCLHEVLQLCLSLCK